MKAAMTNEKIPEVPQTGDESNIGFWIGLAAVALGASGCLPQQALSLSLLF